DAGRPRPLLRHLLLPTRLPVLEAATGPQAAAPGLGSAVRLRAPDRRRPRARGLRPPPDDRLAPCDVHEEDRPLLLAGRPALEAGELGAARDRPGRPVGDAAPDGALLRPARERRPARDASPRPRRRAAGRRRLA